MTQIEMDELREIKWTFPAIKNFEQRAKAVLGRLKVEVPNIQIVNGIPHNVGNVPVANASAHHILASFGRVAEILEVAVAASTGLSWMETKGQPSPAAVAIQGWLEHGNSLDSLAELVYEEFLRASDPLAYARQIEMKEKRKQEVKTDQT